ncbi:hypothetical protein NJ7G_0184 [Natrinema sp. J7-2]|nr:hypothetical protein NJ7G_0184 [Natrinema sp. J7-2]
MDSVRGWAGVSWLMSAREWDVVRRRFDASIMIQEDGV